MSKIKLDILKIGGKIYYSDTDSIVTDVELNKKKKFFFFFLVYPKIIGKFKLEYEIDIAIMPAPKVYYFKKSDNVLKNVYDIIKGGINLKKEDDINIKLTSDDFEKMLSGQAMKIQKRYSKTD
jgi:hypothetical protein